MLMSILKVSLQVLLESALTSIKLLLRLKNGKRSIRLLRKFLIVNFQSHSIGELLEDMILLAQLEIRKLAVPVTQLLSLRV